MTAAVDAITKIPLSGWIKAAVFSLLMFGVFQAPYSHMIFNDWKKEDFDYCYLIPLIVLYLIWEKRTQLQTTRSQTNWWGLPVFLFGVALYWLGELGGEFFTIYVSAWVILVGVLLIHMGYQKLKIIAFPIFCMLFMYPLPNFLYGKISFQLKLISSRIGVDMMQIYGMTAYREGNVIDLGFTKLQVVDACSGLRYLIPLFLLGLLIAYFSRMALWKKCVLVLSAIPLSIIVNSLRIASVGILYQYWGPAVAEGFFHDFSGWFLFMTSLFLLLIELSLLNLIFREKKKKAGAANPSSSGSSQKKRSAEKSINKNPGKKAPFTVSGVFKKLVQAPFVVVILVLGVTYLATYHVEFRENIPISRSLEEFPLTLGSWNGQSQAMEQRFIDTLDLSDYTIIDYRDDSGKSVNFYVAYYESQRKGESIHSPATCLPGGGWEFKQSGKQIVPVSIDGKNGYPVNRAIMQKADEKQVTYYWFPMRGRVLTNAYQIKFFTFWDAFTRQRTDGALVRLITPVYPDEDAAIAEERLQRFMSAVLPVLVDFLPQ